MDNQGFTIAELAAGIFIGAILVLSIGSISSISHASFERLRQEAEVYNEVHSGFDLMNKAVHNAESVSIDDTSTVLTAGNLVFQKQGEDFIFRNTTDNTTHKIIEGVQNLNLVFSSPSTKFISVAISGKKNKVDFVFTNKVMQRN
jgi:uncharacterized protein YdeI (BOF family)